MLTHQNLSKNMLYLYIHNIYKTAQENVDSDPYVMPLVSGSALWPTLDMS